jgi:hypothetical protein
VANKPKVGSAAWERALPRDPTFVKNTIQALAKRAAAGDREAAETLRAWLARHPDLAPTVRALEDLTARVGGAGCGPWPGRTSWRPGPSGPRWRR